MIYEGSRDTGVMTAEMTLTSQDFFFQIENAYFKF